MKAPLTRADLDPQGCGMPDCKHDHSVLYLHPRCHVKAYAVIRYVKASGELVVTCSKCDAEVCRVLVAEGK